MMEFYTVVLRKSANYWVSLCLENGLVGQGNTQDEAITKLKQAIDSFGLSLESESGICNAPISIKELDEFLAVEAQEPISEVFEMRAVYA